MRSRVRSAISERCSHRSWTHPVGRYTGFSASVLRMLPCRADTYRLAEEMSPGSAACSLAGGAR